MATTIEQAADRLFSLMTRLRRLGATPPPPLFAQVSPSSMAIIDYVATSPNCGIKEMAQGLKLSTPTVSVGVRQLEEAGFIGRQPHPRDKRAVQIFLTPAGQDLYEQTHRFRRRTFERLLSGLTPEERDALLNLLEKALDQTETENNAISKQGNHSP
jgi:DNA-binding MarR family transcriptional regulator